jgi:hypothetical protein
MAVSTIAYNIEETIGLKGCPKISGKLTKGLFDKRFFVFFDDKMTILSQIKWTIKWSPNSLFINKMENKMKP